ncbi:hypothetical protein EJ08DRAFT_284428 [Tothia fuscella]|uniref:Uncharacterized protein n=1 Tax=Tothia fuscella TaxID=1048955 RepID=A0A9P4U2D6_9PEZI|nr:hypothetical protein EJ08DRAFT_284428 [Tothia fuscella]
MLAIILPIQAAFNCIDSSLSSSWDSSPSTNHKSSYTSIHNTIHTPAQIARGSDYRRGQTSCYCIPARGSPYGIYVRTGDALRGTVPLAQTCASGGEEPDHRQRISSPSPVECFSSRPTLLRLLRPLLASSDWWGLLDGDSGNQSHSRVWHFSAKHKPPYYQV